MGRSAMEIMRISAADTARVAAIYRECALWLHAKGLDQWSHYLSEEAVPLVERRLREGEVYVATVEGQDAAVAVLQWDDAFWGERGQDSHAGYLHSLAVRRVFSGRNLGRDLIHWAMQQARARGKTVLRLDTLKENAKLMNYYRELGFQEAGGVLWRGQALQFFEKVL
jgi:ribosomal protein S18 acetylase RimI-like enzyme